jgi:hypothetical protein
MAAIFVNGSGRNEQSVLIEDLHKCSLPNCGSFGQAVLEKILEIDQPETRIIFGRHDC